MLYSLFSLFVNPTVRDDFELSSEVSLILCLQFTVLINNQLKLFEFQNVF